MKGIVYLFVLIVGVFLCIHYGAHTTPTENDCVSNDTISVDTLDDCCCGITEEDARLLDECCPY